MPRFLLLYSGPPTPPDASHIQWREWFDKLGGALVDVGSPMAHGVVMRADGSTSDDALHLNGYSVIQAQDTNEVLELVRDHPLFAAGSEYTIEIFEVRNK